MKRVLSFISKRYNVIFVFILGSIITGTSAYAITVAANIVTYDNTNSGLTSTNIQNAIDELYAKSNTQISNYKATVELYRNSNIVKVMKYDQTENSSTLCITGEEATCEELAPTTSTTYDIGTIVKYKVNNSTTRTFYVLHDDGATLTLQDRENMVDNVVYASKGDYIVAGGTETEWNSCTYVTAGTTYTGCNNKGPVTILPALESATNSWTNVNLQTYTPGVTNIAGINDNGCNSNVECSGAVYTMVGRSVYSRMISVDEIHQVNSNYDSIMPIFMYNYMNNNNTPIQGISSCYWTMNVSSQRNDGAFRANSGHMYTSPVVIRYCGARAVVEINK